ncbi:MAG TPA: fused MFS/spermidine synthase [Kineosporiaceae bacterium]
MPDPRAGVYPISTGEATLVPDGDGRRGWTLMLNGVPSSHLDLDDPLRLDFEYLRWIADVLEVMQPAGEGLRVLHLGGAGCSLARYVAASRPGSRQLVVEIDPDVVELARSAFGVRSTGRLRVRTGDAREVLQDLPDLPDHRYEAVVRDAFAVDRVPTHLTTRGFLTEVSRVLAPGGVYAANMGDGSATLARARAEAATLIAVFAHVALIAEPAQFHGRRYGNVVLLGSHDDLPLAALGRRLASGAVRARMLEGDEVHDFAAGRPPLEDPPDTDPARHEGTTAAATLDASGARAPRGVTGRRP